MNEQELFQFNELLLHVLEGDASVEDCRRLNQILAENPTAMEYYLDYIDICAEISSYGGKSLMMPVFEELGIADDVFKEVIEQDLSDTAAREAIKDAEIRRMETEEALLKSCRPIKSRFGRREVFQGLMRIAAVAVVSLGIIWLDRQLFQAHEKNLPVYANVIDTMDARWESEMSFNAGEALPAGPMKLINGYASIRFVRGAEVILHAPSRFILGGDNMIFLEEGTLSAIIPESAKGFAVHTPGTRIVDYGTEFGVKSLFNNITEVQVFNGRVQAGLDDGADDQKRRSARRELSANQAVQIDVVNRQMTKIPFRHDIFVRQLEDASRFVHTGGQISFRMNMPQSLQVNSIESDHEVFLFPEKQNIILPRDIVVIEPETTNIQTTLLTEVCLAQNLEVSSYLLHIDKMCDNMGRAVVFQGRMRFNRPVLGVINQDAFLKETDAVFGVPGVYYETTYPRRSFPGTNAMFWLSEDRRTLEVVLFKVRNLDEWRILTAASSEGQPSVVQMSK